MLGLDQTQEDVNNTSESPSNKLAFFLSHSAKKRRYSLVNLHEGAEIPSPNYSLLAKHTTGKLANIFGVNEEHSKMIDATMFDPEKDFQVLPENESNLKLKNKTAAINKP